MIGLAIWVVELSGRVGNQEEIRRVEDRAAVARHDEGCAVISALVDVSIDLPLKNIADTLAGNTLTPAERKDRIEAQRRYARARASFRPALKACVK